MNSSTLHEVVDASGETYLLGEILGKGGEGTVFAVARRPTLAAKLFHRTPLDAQILVKLQVMISRRTPALDGVAAWPRAILYATATNEPCGVLAPRVRDARHLHELYGTSARRRMFPQARWPHLVLAARNVAAAFDQLHAAEIVVGDVNQGNLLVDELMRVRFIDCDSFQIVAGEETFPCPVGAPHFTPPELQGKKLRDAERTVDHDRFGLAVLIFHLLFVGRHPFAGRFFGAGDQTIEQAIAERRFAFSKDKRATLMEPPPASLQLDDLPGPIGELFERAFRQPEGVAHRPAAREWVDELDRLLGRRQACSFDPAHLYYDGLTQCPWCRIEDEGGPAFFVVDGSTSIIAPKRIEHLEARLRRLKFPAFPELLPQQLKIPQAIAPKRLRAYGRPSSADAATTTLAAAAVCLAAPFAPWALIAGTAASLAGAAWLLASKAAKENRRRHDAISRKLVEEQNKLQRKARAIAAAHAQRQQSFEQSTAELKTEATHYRAADTQLRDLLALFRLNQLNQFLSSHLILEHIAEIPGMTPAMAAVLQSYGIESPRDVDHIKLLGIPMLHDGLTLELSAWRDRVARNFVFKPEHGVNLSEAEGGGKAAVARFKVAQARRILMASHQLDSLAKASSDRLDLERKHFERSAEPARELANELRVFQSARRPWERALNTAPTKILAASLAAPTAGSLLYWLFA
jgi:DNA-binding helix-hairpin-helix protein with protein kinase domain